MGIQWEYLGQQSLPPGNVFPVTVETWRSAVPGGWLVLVLKKDAHGDSISTMFYPDAQHEWDGGSLR